MKHYCKLLSYSLSCVYVGSLNHVCFMHVLPMQHIQHHPNTNIGIAGFVVLVGNKVMRMISSPLVGCTSLAAVYRVSSFLFVHNPEPEQKSRMCVKGCIL